MLWVLPHLEPQAGLPLQPLMRLEVMDAAMEAKEVQGHPMKRGRMVRLQVAAVEAAEMVALVEGMAEQEPGAKFGFLVGR